MSNSDDGEEGFQRKRKLNLLDFIKNEEVPQEVEEEEEEPKRYNTSLNFQSPRAGIDGPQGDDYDDYDDEGDVNMDDEDYNSRPSFGAGRSNMLFTPAAPMTFQKAKTDTIQDVTMESSESEEENSKPKLSYSELESLDKPSTSSRGAFKGKKYGIGAAILKNMGFVEGQGLGKHGQGIKEPIQQDVRKMGVGIGGGVDKTAKKSNNKVNVNVDEDENSSDEEFYKDVPKKSLYQIINEIENKGYTVPDEVKKISDQLAEDSHKPFITLRKEGNENVEELTLELDNLNNQLEDIAASLKLAEFEEQELLRSQKQTEGMISSYEILSQIIDSLLETADDPSSDNLTKSAKLREQVKALENIDKQYITDFDIHKTIIVAIKPILKNFFNDWNPLDFSSDTVLEELILWKDSIPEDPNELYGELNYFQSLVYSLWYPKIVEALSDWTVDQPNVAITLLLDWNEVLEKSVIDFVTLNLIKPKIITAIQDWDPKGHSENAPYLWIFEYLPYLETAIDEIKQEFIAKYGSLLENWNPNDNIEGLGSLREIVGFERFDKLIKEKLLPTLVKQLLNYHLIFEEPNGGPISVLYQWKNFINAQAFDVLLRLTLLNSWKRELYQSLRGKDAKFSHVSFAFRKWVVLFNLHDEESQTIKSEVYDVLDMINDFIDTGRLVPVHESSLSATKIITAALEQVDKPESFEAKTSGIPTHKLQVSFKEVVDNYCTDNNLFITPIKNDLSSGHSLFKISDNTSGKNGLVAYIEEDVLYIRHTNGKYEPISLDTLYNRL